MDHSVFIYLKKKFAVIFEKYENSLSIDFEKIIWEKIIRTRNNDFIGNYILIKNLIAIRGVSSIFTLHV